MKTKKENGPHIAQTPSKVYLLNEINASQQVHAKVNKIPVDALLLVLFLLQYKHVMVEELLQLLVGEVDAQLLEAIVLYYSTASREVVNGIQLVQITYKYTM